MKRNNWLWRRRFCFALDFLCVLSLLLRRRTCSSPPFALLQPWSNLLLFCRLAQAGFHLAVIFIPFFLCLTCVTFSHVVSRWGARLFQGVPSCRDSEWRQLDVTSRRLALNGVHWQVICCLVSAEIKEKDRMTSRRSPMLGVISDARAEICSSENRTSLQGQSSLWKGLLRMTHKPL